MLSLTVKIGFYETCCWLADFFLLDDFYICPASFCEITAPTS